MRQITLLLSLLLVAYSNAWAQPNSPSGLDFSASDTVGCGPLVVTFYSAVPGAVSWNWDFGNGNTSVQQTPVEVFSTSGIYTVGLEVVYQDGSTGFFEKTNFIEVLLSPTIDISVNTLMSCVNSNSFQFTNNSLNATQYLWDFGDGSISTDINPDHHYNADGIYNLNFFATSIDGCMTNSVLPNLQVFPVVQSNIQVNGNSSACDSSTLFAFEAFPIGMNSYSWEFSDGAQLNGATIQHGFNSYGLFDVMLVTADGNGCLDSTSVLGVVEISNVSDDFTVSANNVCEMTDVFFYANAVGATSVSWDFGDGSSGTGFSPSHAYASIGQYDVTMTTNRLNGCGQTITKSNHLEVLSPPNMMFNLSDSVVCVNESVIFESISTNAQSVKWLFGDGAVSMLPQVTHHYDTPGVYTATLIYGSGGCFDTLSRLISVSQPEADFQNSSFSNCAPADVQFSSLSSAAVNWEWTFSNGVTSTMENPIVTFNYPGQFDAQLVVTDGNGCKDTMLVNNALEISSNTPPNFQSANFEGCAPLAISFYNYSVGLGFWNWNFGDGTTGSGPAPSHVYSSQGEYVVSLVTMDSLGCNTVIDTFAIITVNSLQIDSIDLQLDCSSLMVDFSVDCSDCLFGNWNFGDGNSSATSNILYEYTGAGPYDVTYTGVSDLGCVGSRLFTLDLESCFYQGGLNGLEAVASDETVAWVSDPDSGAVVAAYEYCNPVTINIENPVPNAVSWTWYYGDGEVGSGAQPNHAYDSIGLYSLMLEYYDGVTYDTLYYPNYINVIGHTNSILVNSNSSCNYMDLNLMSQDTMLMDYYWSIDNVLISQNFHSVDTMLLNNNQLHSITLTSLDSNNCSYSSSVGVISTGLDPQFIFDANLCVGDSLIIQHDLPNNYQLHWDFGTPGFGFFPRHVYTSEGIYDVSVVATDATGCELVFDLGEVEVSEARSDFTVTSAGNLCVGDTVYAVANNYTNDVYNWSFNNVSMIANGVNAYGVVQASGTYDISLETTINGCSSMTTQTAVYSVNQAQADFTFSQDVVCLPVEGQFTDLSVNPVSWNWNFGDGTTSHVQNPSHTYVSDSLAQITLSIVDDNGCAASVTKSNIEIFSIHMGVSAVSGCAPVEIEFLDYSHTAVKWEWSFGDGGTDSIQDPIHDYTVEGVYDVSLIVTSADGCVDTMIKPAMIAIDKVVADFQSSVSGGCAPQPAYFTDNSYNASSWHWDFGNGAVSTMQNPIQIYFVGGNYDVELIVESLTGCTDTVYSPSPMSIVGPAADFSIVDSIVCVGDSISFVNNSQNADNYTWLFGDGNSSGVVNPSVEYDSSGLYTISLIVSDTNGCQQITSQTHQISIEPLPDASFSLSDTIGCAPLLMSLSASSIGMSYDWQLNGVTIGSGASQNITLPVGAHTVSLLVESPYGCVDSIVVEDIEVYPVYSPQISGLDPICETQDSVVVNSSLAMGNWYIGGVSNVSNHFDVSILAPGDYTIRQEIQTYCGSSDSVVLHIDSLVTAAMPLSQVACENDSLICFGSATNIGFWTGVGVVNPYSGIVDPGSANHGENMLTYTIINGSCIFIDSTVLLVNNQPDAEFLIDNEVLCQGQEWSIDAPFNDSLTSYNWSFVSESDTLLSNAINPELILNPGIWSVGLEVIDEGCSSSYRLTDVVVHDTIAPHSPSIIRSTVLDNEAVLTEWEEPSYGREKISNFQIWRSIDSVNFSLIDNVGNMDLTYVDYHTKVDAQNYYYLIIPTNVCDVLPEKVNMSSSILLQKKEIENDYLQFNWTEYYQWKNGVDYYELQKQNINGEWETIQRLDSTVVTTTIERP